MPLIDRVRAWVVPVGLFLLAVGIRALAAAPIDQPPTEGSAYYSAVAANLVQGRGLVTDTLWSYATPPLEVPRAAFELWLPMASFVSAASMAVLGPTFGAGQVAFILLGASVAPMTWAIGREAATAHGLDARRGGAVALAAGVLAALLAPFLVAAAGPDSTTPFLVFGTLAAWLMPRALPNATAGRLVVPAALGAVLGLTWLSRQEAIWLGVAYLLLVVGATRAADDRPRRIPRILAPTVVTGVLVVAPWLVRQAIAFGSPFTGQALDNALLTRNEQIFGYLERPELVGFLAQGPLAIGGHVAEAVVHQLLAVLVLPAFPVGLIGLASVVALRRSPAIRGATALGALLLSGGLTFLATAVLFPVATLWGTFLHASGPLLVGLIVASALGGDALLARISAVRRWERPNIIVAPVALVAVAVVLGALQVATLARQTQRMADRFASVADALAARSGTASVTGPDGTQGTAIISDHPMWLSDATGRPTLALPDEPLTSLTDLAGRFGASTVVVFDQRGRYPDLLRSSEAQGCLAAAPVAIGPADAPAWLFRLDPAGCRP